MASTSSVTAQQVAERLLRRAAPPSVSADDIASTAAALLDLARAGDITEEQIDRVIAGHIARPRSSAGERPLSEVNFLTVLEVATLMQVSKMTVYRLVHSGELPAIRVGRSFRVPEQAVYDYMRELHDHHPGQGAPRG
ncbi:excisionase family DNA binding protein [Nonomuraea thailandensis]|uniref:Excisionase family DNA binding protein n=2 Tax=Nonomuraea thailandensis TaxID=1188745 RepID=A0A9X2KD61_9ACTN|nr:excisionase family DNA binding protein [Nonomuraea thailandensis]